MINIDKQKRNCHALVKRDQDDTSWLVMSCISSHADHLRRRFSRKLEGVKHPISRRSGNCVFLVQEGAHFNNENRSNIRFDVSWCRYVNAYVRCRGTLVWLGPDAFSPSSLFSRTSIFAIRVHDDQLPCGSSRTRRCLRMSRRRRNVLADVLHFRRFRVREATDRTPRFSILLGRLSSVPVILSCSLPLSHFEVSGRRSWHGEGARCGGRREWEALSTRDRAG